MKTGAGLALICVGAILAFAVTANTSVFNIHIAGWVLMIVGVAGIFVSRRTYSWLGRRTLVRRTRDWPGNGRAQNVAGLPPAPEDIPPAPGSTVPSSTVPGSTIRGDTEVVEDLYEQ
jgi:Domain of unknown function (DUF6458)